jgi:phosphopantothenoylcysteine decarboxylase / phosphopantothenate---cysteine ligase
VDALPFRPRFLMTRRILLIIGGGVAAYKSLELIRLCKRVGIAVTPVLTKAAKEFVTPLSVAALAGEKVYDDLFSLTDEVEMGHIALSRSADLVVVAPATANLLARMANGLADEMATVALLATDKRILVAPAMNVRMWHHHATQRNLAQLRADGVEFIGPDAGAMACGEFGKGRLAEPPVILAAIEAALKTRTALPDPDDAAFIAAKFGASGLGRPLAGRHVVITSGPTHEPIDPVRYIANRSSGKQGHAIAAAAAAAGARVTLISGPVTIPDPPGVTTIHVETAREIDVAMDQALPADIAIFCAAVADWRAAQSADEKIKKVKGEGPAPLALTENPDILARIARHPTHRPKLVIGFAAETANMLAHAQDKLVRKGCDIIIANDVGSRSAVPGGVMGSESNAVTLIDKDKVEPWPQLSKAETAARLIAELARRISA